MTNVREDTMSINFGQSTFEPQMEDIHGILSVSERPENKSQLASTSCTPTPAA